MQTRESIMNDILEDWGDEFLYDVVSAARKKVKSESQDIELEVIRATASSSAHVMLTFESHLRYYDMRKIDREKEAGPEGIRRIKEWILRKGLDNFLSGYKYPTEVTIGGVTKPVPVTRILNNIAWGISRKKKRFRRRKWYNQMKGKAVYQLYFDLVDAVAKNAVDVLKKPLIAGQAVLGR